MSKVHEDYPWQFASSVTNLSIIKENQLSVIGMQKCFAFLILGAKQVGQCLGVLTAL